MDMLLQVDLADSEHDRLFAFESDFVSDLRCIPMAVRLKLDRVGIKMTLKQWARAGVANRRTLLQAPCSRPEDVVAYEKLLRSLIRDSGAGELKLLAHDSIPLISRLRPPETVVSQCQRDGLPRPDAAGWVGLSTLEKFVLVKLSRDNHDNVNFPAALREITQSARAAASPA